MRDVVSGERLPSDALADGCAERGGVEEHIDRRVRPPEAGLTIRLKLLDRSVGCRDVGGERNEPSE